MPYRVEMFPYGRPARDLPTKVYTNGRNGAGQILTDEELAVWQYVEHLEAELLVARNAVAVLPTEESESVEAEPKPAAKAKKK